MKVPFQHDKSVAKKQHAPSSAASVVVSGCLMTMWNCDSDPDTDIIVCRYLDIKCVYI